jgi:hypothetical protein
MKEDLARFSGDVKKSIQNTFLARDEEGKKKILDVADAYKVPCVIIVFWCGEVSGWPDYLKKSLDSLIKFYGYTEIRHKPDGCPWSDI